MFGKFWVPHESKVFELVELVSESDQEMMVISLDDGIQRTVQKADAKVADETHLKDFDDLCYMNNLHEAPLLNMLQRRFQNGKIYTNTGNILISMNPYSVIPEIYDNPKGFLDLSIDEGEDSVAAPMTPHVFVIANNALRILTSGARDDNVFATKRVSLEKSSTVLVNQSIIVSGESGAGKTEASKQVMNFLIMANDVMCSLGARGNRNINLLEVGEKIKHVLLESNVILEAFGNSKTVRNDNSSRFGKYIKLQYTSDNQLLSAFTDTFLLEKSRLVSVGKFERNYHVFYQMIRGLKRFEPELANRLRLLTVESFDILTAGECTIIGSEDNDVHNFQALQGALTTLGCSQREIIAVWELLSVILHLGNTVVLEPSAGVDNAPCSLSCSTMPLDEIAGLLAISSGELITSTTTHRVQAGKRGSVHIKVLQANDVRNNQSSLIKWLYRNIFNWLIRKVNFAHSSVSSGDSRDVVKFIGILDIFGFEILGINSFEQLCINFTNERLQQQFNEHVFVLEQQEYAREGLSWNAITFRDNQHVIDLISKKPTGLLHILEEHGMMNRKPDDLALLASYISAHEKSSSAFSKTRFAGESFIVKHFAGEVVYSIEGFLSKNNNSMQEDLQELISSSRNDFLQNACNESSTDTLPDNPSLGYIPFGQLRLVPSGVPNPGPVTAAGGKKMASADTVSYQFRNQLELLIGTLRLTNPHYIKCIKPNASKLAGVFDAKLVHEQLRYSGALEVVRIRREGFPTRIQFIDFYAECALLARGRSWLSPATCNDEQAKVYAVALAREYLKPGKFQAGNNLLFLTDGCLGVIRGAIMDIYNSNATRIQNNFRRYNNVSKYSKARRALFIMQHYVRRFVRRMRSLKEVRTRWARREKEAAELKARLEREAAELKARLEKEAYELRLRLEREEAERKAKFEKEEAERQRRFEIEELERRMAAEKLAAEERAAAELVRLKIEADRKREEETRRAAEEERRRKEKEEEDRLLAEIEALRLAEEERVLATRKEFAANRLARYFGSLLRNSALKKRLGKLCDACACCDEATALHYIASHPEDAFIIMGKMSLVEIALKNGCILAPSHIFKLALKDYPNQVPSIISVLMKYPRIEVLTNIASSIDDIVSTTHKTPRPASKATASVEYVPIAVNLLDEAGGGQGKLYSGRLFKKRGTNDWKARWCVVTATDILYFAQPNDSIPKGAVPLAGCTIRRYSGEPSTFEVLAPNIVTKKTFFGAEKVKAMLFRANNEQEYFEWIFVLRAVTGSIGSLRDTPISVVHSRDRHDIIGQQLVEFKSTTDSDDVNSLAVQYWIELSKNSACCPNWVNAVFTKNVLFIPGYTYGRLTVFHQNLVNSLSRLFVESKVSLSLSVENSQSQIIAQMGEISTSKLCAKGSALFWGATVLVNMPIENIEDNSVLYMFLNVGDVAKGRASVDLMRPGLQTIAIAPGDEYESTVVVLVEWVRYEL